MVFSLEQLAKLAPPPLHHGSRWGAWTLDADRLVLIHTPDGYEIDLEGIDSSAAMLDWVYQVQRWASPQDVADLLTALDDIFHPQANLCSGGGDKRIESPTAFLRRRIRRRPAVVKRPQVEI